MVARQRPVSDFRFAAVVHTRGEQPALLAEALASLSYQRPVCAAIVAVQAPLARLEAVRDICRRSGAATRVLPADDVGRWGGYAFNVGLAHCYDAGGFDGLFFLGDGDIVYPNFTRRMAQAFIATGADVVYAAGNRRLPGKAPEPGRAPPPFVRLLVENVIPIHSYAIRCDRLAESRPWFDETLAHTADWFFLLQLLARGFRFEPLDDTLSEFREPSEGHRAVDQDPQGWEREVSQIRAYIDRTRFPVAGALLVDLALQMPRRAGSIPDDRPVSDAASDPRALLLWEQLRKWWHCLPASMRKTIVRLHQRWAGGKTAA